MASIAQVSTVCHPHRTLDQPLIVLTEDTIHAIHDALHSTHQPQSVQLLDAWSRLLVSVPVTTTLHQRIVVINGGSVHFVQQTPESSVQDKECMHIISAGLS